MNFVNVINKIKADELHKLGFKSIEQLIGDKTIYAFSQTPELMNYLNSNFSNQEFFIDKTMRF